MPGTFMEFEPKAAPQNLVRTAIFAATERTLLVWLRDTERSLRRKTLTAIVPLLPNPLALNLGETSLVDEEAMNQLAEIDLNAVDAADL
ncbi:hypothetical protein [Stenomitos frigidus]